MVESLKGLRILLTTDAVGGVWTYSLDLARALSRAGLSVVLAVLGPPPDEEAAAAARAILRLEVIVTGLPLDWTAMTEDEVLAAGAALAGMARELRCGLVQLHTPALAAGRSFSVPVIAVHHSCLATWWRAVKGKAEIPEDIRWRSALVARGIAAAEDVVAPTTAHAHAIAAAYALPAPPTVIRNGRQPLPPQAKAKAGEVPPPFIFTSGRLWDEGKNIARLAAAAALIDTPVIAAGATESPAGAGVSLPALRLAGHCGEAKMRHWLSLASAYVAVPLYEPFGLGILEAAQAGCPLVLSDIPSLRELWAGAAQFVPAADEAAIAAALRGVMADAGLRERLGYRARYRAALYGVDAMAKDMLRLYALHLKLYRPRNGRVA